MVFKISEKDGKRLLELARKSILEEFGKKFSFRNYSDFNYKRGVFVTLTSEGDLRGCIGFPYPFFSLDKAVYDSAKSAAFNDPRFNPVSEEDISGIKIEISVLTEPKLIKAENPEDYAGKIRIGSDGLIIEKDGKSGLLLPQVFEEYGVDSKKALEMVCEKAWLPRNAWKDKNAKIYRFEAQIFREK